VVALVVPEAPAVPGPLLSVLQLVEAHQVAI